MQPSHLLLIASPTLLVPISQLGSILAGPGECGEVLDPLWAAPEQEALLADLYPYSRGSAELLHAGPWQCGLSHHDGTPG